MMSQAVASLPEILVPMTNKNVLGRNVEKMKTSHCATFKKLHRCFSPQARKEAFLWVATT